MKLWSEFDRYDYIIDKYMPMRGEGTTKATQIVTAVNKLVYKWFNDGDVYDNTGALDGWCNDLSSYANWLRKYGKQGSDYIMEGIYDCYTDGDYEDLLFDICEWFFDDEYLEEMNNEQLIGSIYDCDGIFRFEEQCDDDDEDWY